MTVPERAVPEKSFLKIGFLKSRSREDVPEKSFLRRTGPTIYIREGGECYGIGY